MDTKRDINLQRKPGKLNGIRYAKNLFDMRKGLSGYDIVQIISPIFLDLKPWLNHIFFDYLRKNNKQVGLTVAGSDSLLVKSMCESGTLRYNEFRINGKLTDYAKHNRKVEQSWLKPNMIKHCRYIYKNVDFAISALYEYHRMAMPYLGDKLRYLGIPVNTSEYKISSISGEGPLNIFVGIKSEYMTFKGTDRLLSAAKRVASEYPGLCRVTEARDLTLIQYTELMSEADVVLDQVYSYTPATNALQAMAMGKIAVSGGEPEYYKFIKEERLHPIVNVLPSEDDIYQKLKNLVTDRKYAISLSEQGPIFVKKHNDADLLAQKYLEICKC